MLEGLRGEESIAAPCRREGIAEARYSGRRRRGHRLRVRPRRRRGDTPLERASVAFGWGPAHRPDGERGETRRNRRAMFRCVCVAAAGWRGIQSLHHANVRRANGGAGSGPRLLQGSRPGMFQSKVAKDSRFARAGDGKAISSGRRVRPARSKGFVCTQ